MEMEKAMFDVEVDATLARIYGADEPWSEFLLWLKELNAHNQSMGGSEDTLIAFIVYWTMNLSLPVGVGDQQ